MTLLQLQYALSVQKHGHFGRAAEENFVTQPTLSQQIQKLEELLGVTLFDRSQQPITATAQGTKILVQAQAVIQEMKRLEEMVSPDRDQVEGDLRLGVIPTLAPYVLPLFLKSFLNTYPKVNLIIEELQTPEIVKRLKAESLDVGLLVTPLQEAQIQEWPLFYELFYLYASAHHAILKRKTVAEKDLSQQEIFLMSEGHCFREQALNLCKAQWKGSAHGRLTIDSGSLNTLKKLVDQGQGYTLLPELALPDLLKDSERKRLRTFEAPSPYREVSLVHNRYFAKKKSIDALKQQITAGLPKDLQQRKPKKSQVIPISE